jgi:hypothetical protein
MSADPAGTSRELLDGALVLADAMNQAHAKYALIGGLAAGFRTFPRFTRDIDVLLYIPQIALAPLLTDLAHRGFEFDETATIREWTQHHMCVLSYRGIRVDWLKAVLPVYEHVLDRAITETWLGHPIRVASAEGLIVLKLLAFRTQDQLDIENLVAAHRERLDLAWIRSEWQTVEPLDDPRIGRLEELAATAKS